MKASLITAVALCAKAAQAAPFTIGNIAAIRVGDGATTISTAAFRGDVVEFTTSGTVVQTIPLPTAASGGNGACTFLGSATSYVPFGWLANGQGIIAGCEFLFAPPLVSSGFLLRFSCWGRGDWLCCCARWLASRGHTYIFLLYH